MFDFEFGSCDEKSKLVDLGGVEACRGMFGRPSFAKSTAFVAIAQSDGLCSEYGLESIRQEVPGSRNIKELGQQNGLGISEYHPWLDYCKWIIVH